MCLYIQFAIIRVQHKQTLVRKQIFRPLSFDSVPMCTKSPLQGFYANYQLRTSSGFGAWTTAMLRDLPTQAASEAASIFTLMEATHSPEDLRRAIVTMMPKAEGVVKASQRRPISVLPLLSRTWSSTRFSVLQTRVDGYVSSSQYGGRSGHSAMEPLCQLLAKVTCTEPKSTLPSASTTYR